MDNPQTHLVVDMLYDFIDGTLACTHAEEAVNRSIEYINAHPGQKVLYVCDCHPADHCSFQANGGVWPVHCVKDTRGGAIHKDYYTRIENPANRPTGNNIFYKGCAKELEEYSGCNAVNNRGKTIRECCSGAVTISGIATEYCIKETVLALYQHGCQITLLQDALAYVHLRGHRQTLAELGKIVAVK